MRLMRAASCRGLSATTIWMVLQFGFAMMPFGRGLSAPGFCALSGRRDGGSAFRMYQQTSAALPALSRLLHRTLTAADPRRRVTGSWWYGSEGCGNTAERRLSQATVHATPHGRSRTCGYCRRMSRRCRSRPVIALRPASAGIGASTIGVGLSDSRSSCWERRRRHRPRTQKPMQCF